MKTSLSRFNALIIKLLYESVSTHLILIASTNLHADFDEDDPNFDEDDPKSRAADPNFGKLLLQHIEKQFNNLRFENLVYIIKSHFYHHKPPLEAIESFKSVLEVVNNPMFSSAMLFCALPGPAQMDLLMRYEDNTTISYPEFEQAARREAML